MSHEYSVLRACTTNALVNNNNVRATARCLYLPAIVFVFMPRLFGQVHGGFKYTYCTPVRNICVFNTHLYAICFKKRKLCVSVRIVESYITATLARTHVQCHLFRKAGQVDDDQSAVRKTQQTHSQQLCSSKNLAKKQTTTSLLVKLSL